MARSYGVIWRDRGGRTTRGRLELGSSALRLVGSAADAGIVDDLAYADVAGVRVGRRTDERIDGQRTVVVDRCDGGAVAIAGLVEPPGLIAELVDELTALQHAHGRHRVAVVVPLLPGSRDAVRALLAQGPPFDADELGLDRHGVFVTDDEAVFVFDWHGDASLDRLLAQPGVWAHASAWQEHLAGAPRIADPAYAWTRPAGEVDEAVLPPGLHA